MNMNKEEKGFSIGRLDIVDLYEWKQNDKLVYQTYFQRQFVWREKDKRDLIDTIIKGLPIPAIFICDAGTDFTTLSKTYNVLDGRQRLESIFEFLDNKYPYNGKFFSDMEEEEKKCILNYNVTLIQMYIDPDDTDKIKEIFKRLNKNSYNLNRMEKQSTQLVEYDYMIIAKIVSGIIQFENIDAYLEEIQVLFEEDENCELLEEERQEEIVGYSIEDDKGEHIPDDIKTICVMNNIEHIHDLLTSNDIFTEYDKRRQIALQYFLNIFTCIYKGELINRNVTEKEIIILSDENKNALCDKLILYNNAAYIIKEMIEYGIDKFWKNKTSFFTISYLFAMKYEKIKNMSIEVIVEKLSVFQNSETEDWNKYYDASSQGVNDKKQRELRNKILEGVLFG